LLSGEQPLTKKTKDKKIEMGSGGALLKKSTTLLFWLQAL